MSWREFIASLVDSLAWPAAAAVIVVVLRRQLASLVEGPVKRWKAGPVEVEYWEQEAARVTERVVASTIPSSVEEDEEADRLMALATIAPAAAVIESFGLVEQELRSIAAASGVPDAELRGASRLAAEAAVRGAVTPESVEAIRGLSVLRNLAAHGGAPKTTPQRAREFVVLAQAVLYALRSGPQREGLSE